MASQTLIHGEDNREFRVMAAPGPEEVRCGVRREGDSAAVASQWGAVRSEGGSAESPLVHCADGSEQENDARLSAISVLQVNWRSVWVSYRDRAVRGWIFKPLLALFILIPVGMFSAAMMQLQLFLCPSHK